MTLRSLRPTALTATLLVLPVLLLAQDRADVDRTQIIGNRELPKVLYIVPWKKPLPGDLAGRPLVSVVDEALAPIDRDVFRREVSYGAQVRAKAPSSNEPPAQAEKDSPDTSAPANK